MFGPTCPLMEISKKHTRRSRFLSSPHVFSGDPVDFRFRGNDMCPQKGFTLIELIMVMVMIGILVVVASTRLQNLPNTRAQFAMRKMQSDVRYAQILAMESQKRTRVVFSTGSDTYDLQYETTPSNWSAITHPATKSNFSVQLNTGDFSGVDITQASLNSGSSVTFDSYGAPFNSSDTALTEPAYVELNAAYQLRFRAETGKVDIVTL